MSFFKKMVDKIEDMVGDDDKKDKKAKEDKQEHGEGLYNLCYLMTLESL